MLPKSLEGKDARAFKERAQACYNFCVYNKARIDEYRELGRKLAASCAERSKDPKVRPAAEHVKECAEELEKLWLEENENYRGWVKGWHYQNWLKKAREQIPDFPGLMPEAELQKMEMHEAFFKHLRDYYINVYDTWAQKDNTKAQALIYRSHWTTPGGTLDGIVAGERRLAQRDKPLLAAPGSGRA